MRLRHAGQSDPGRVRANNEDAWFADDALGLYIVCDGVGGRAHGEIAARVTVDHIHDWIAGEAALLDRARAAAAVDGELLGRLRVIVRSAIQNACYLVHGMGQIDPEQRGMSTTTSVLLAVGRTGILGQVGDSRVYRSRWLDDDGRRRQEIQQLTEDHTIVQAQVRSGHMTPEQAKTSGLKNIITRAVGQKEYVDADITTVDLEPGDRVLLCTDGLHDYLDRGLDIAALFALELEAAAHRAIELANERGGQDNITALFVELAGD